MILSINFDSILVLLSGQVALKDMANVFLLGQLLTPHGSQPLCLPSTAQVEEVVVLQLSERRGGGVTPATVGEVIPLLSSVDVALRSHRPEDWTDVFRVTPVIGCWFPWQWLESKRVFTPHAESL